MSTRTFIAGLVLAAGIALPAAATSILPLFLDELVGHAAVVFEGTCVDNRTERDPATGLVVTYTTFAVRDVLKGQPSGMTHVIKQVGGEAPDGGPSFRIQGVPRFVTGRDYVVFLAGVSDAGFSSPIGLGQGHFDVRREGAEARVRSGRDFRDLTANLASRIPDGVVQRLQRTPGPVRDMELEEFKRLVRAAKEAR